MRKYISMTSCAKIVLDLVSLLLLLLLLLGELLLVLLPLLLHLLLILLAVLVRIIIFFIVVFILGIILNLTDLFLHLHWGLKHRLRFFLTNQRLLIVIRIFAGFAIVAVSTT